MECPFCGQGLRTEGIRTYCLSCRRVRDGLGKRYVGARLPDNVKLPPEFLVGERSSLYIWGPVGTGKTYLAAAIGYCKPRGLRTISAPELMSQLRDSFNEDSESERKIVDRYANSKLLILDDLGAGKTSSEFTLQSLYLIIDRRYRQEKPMIITSNFSLAELATRLDKRISSRIAGMCLQFYLGGKDRRNPIKET